MSSWSEHCFAGQRTGLESPPVVLEHIHDAVDHFLGEAHAPPIDFAGDWTEVDGESRLRFAEERFTPLTKRVS